MKNLKRFLSVFLVVVIVLVSAPLNGFVGLELPDWLNFNIKAKAQTDDAFIYTISGGKVKITGCYSSKVGSDVVIPSTIGGYPVTEIKDSIFYDNDTIKSVTLPDTITEIKTHSFSFCDNLVSVKLPNNLKTIWSFAFYGCKKLKNIDIPDSVTRIDIFAFADCDSLESIKIPNNLDELKTNTFSDCDNLKYITIGKSVELIHEDAFASNKSLISITVDEENQFFSNDENGILYNKDKTTLVQYPIGKTANEFTTPAGVKRIHNQAFAESENLSSVIISDDVEIIDAYAFCNCINLSNIEFGKNLKALHGGAFYSCIGLTSVCLPDGVGFISENTFTSCTGLTTVILGDNVKTIGSAAFANCTNLKNIRIPKSLKEVGEDAFYICPSVENIYYSGTREDWENIYVAGWYNDGFDVTKVHFECDIPHEHDYVERVIMPTCTSKGYTSHNCKYCGDFYKTDEVPALGHSYEESLTAPTCTEEGYITKTCTVCEYSYVASNISAVGHKYVENIVPPTCFKTGYTKYVCEVCDHFYTGNKTSRLPHVAGEFKTENYDGKNFEVQRCNECNEILSSFDTSFYTYIVENEEVTITSCVSTTEGDITVPPIIDNYPVTAIGDYAFVNCTKIKSVTVSENVKTIGDNAFFNCSSLDVVELPETMTSIGNSAFEFCDSLGKINIGSNVEYIGEKAFANCAGLNSITVDSNNLYYSSDSNGVLYDKDKTALIQYPANSSVTDFTVLDSVLSIGDFAFVNAFYLTDIVLGENVTDVGDNSFWCCITLESITFDNNVTSIGSGAFSSCSALKDVYYYGTEEEWNSVDVGSGNMYLTNATIHFVEKKPIEVVKGSSAVIDEETKTIYGLEEGVYDLEGFVECNGCVLEYNPTAFGFGTGTTVDIVKNGEVVDTYTIVIFGDINGDGYVDAFDVPDVMAFVNYSSQYESGSAQEMAADINGDGFVDESDLFLIDLASTFAYTVEQSR